MSLDADLLADRRRLRRRLTLWRALAIFALFGALALVAGVRETSTVLTGGAHVLRLPVNGFIAEDRRLMQASTAPAAPSRAGRRCTPPSRASPNASRWWR